MEKEMTALLGHCHKQDPAPPKTWQISKSKPHVSWAQQWVSVKLTGGMVRILALSRNQLYEGDQVIIFSVSYPLIHKMGNILMYILVKIK